MAQVPIWPGSGSLDEVTESTPYGFYDNEVLFVTHSVKTAEWTAKRLGYPINEVELQAAQIYTCFEEAVTEYGAIVNQYNIKDNIAKLRGAPTSSNYTHKLVTHTGRVTISNKYGAEAGVGGDVDWNTGFVSVNSGSQVYDLKDWATVSASGKPIEIKRIFHENTPAMTRYFDPYVGTGQGYQNMLDGFGWGGMSPAVTFTLMPIYSDLLRIQTIELNDQVRKSAYSFELINNKLRVFPIPTNSFKMYFQYIVKEDAFTNVGEDVQSDFSNIRYDNMLYTNINDVGKQWIRKYTLALTKELLGMVRSKYGSIPLPGGETTLDGDTLRSEAAAEKEVLVTQLREILEGSTGNQLMEDEANESDLQQTLLNKVPLKIYIG